jgi:hypothetical protein
VTYVFATGSIVSLRRVHVFLPGTPSSQSGSRHPPRGTSVVVSGPVTRLRANTPWWPPSSTRTLACLLLAGVALASGARSVAGSSESAPASVGRLENPEVGYSLRYPADWRIAGHIVATEFATAARCESVQVVDGEPPADSGPAPFVIRSFVQICVMPVTDGLSLDEFMRRTYGSVLLRRFSPTRLGGRPAYRADAGGAQTNTVLQTRSHRMQIVSGVTSRPDLGARRAAEIRAILDSLSFDRGS